MDFMHDQLADGRTLRVLTIVDAYTRECVVLEAKRTFTGSDVAVTLRAAGRDRALPSRITCDNGSEFTARAVDHWAYWNRVTLIFSRPGKPTDNGLIEAFNGTLRRECLAPTLFTSIEDAQAVLNTWRAEYNNVRPHSSLQHLPPAHFRGEQLHRGPEWTPRLSRLTAQILGRDHPTAFLHLMLAQFRGETTGMHRVLVSSSARDLEVHV